MDTKNIIGKTISAASLMKRDGYDDEGWLKLEFSDGTFCVVVAGYGCYTGNSNDEYPTYIDISDDISGLVPVEPNE